MTVQTTRRKLLRLAAALPVSFPFFAASARENAGPLSYYPVKNQVSGSGVKVVTTVLIDPGCHSYDGDGLYLYPDWGNPVVYEVRKRGARLAFHFPDDRVPLWWIDAGQRNARFSGRVQGVLTPEDAAASGFPLLNVPDRQPA